MKRGAITKGKGSRMLTVWVPDVLIPLLDHGVQATDLDRSKFIRAAIREKVARLPHQAEYPKA